MKFVSLLFTFAACIMATVAVGQTKYYKMPDGKIVDSILYEKAKLASIEEYKKEMSPLVKLQEFLAPAYTNGDSAVFTYTWRHYDPYQLRPASGINLQKYLGKQLPDATLKTIDKTSFHLKEIKGKPTLINFWFINCPPCVSEMPMLNALQQELKDSVNFIAISLDWRKEVSNFLKKQEYNFLHIIDARWFIGELGISRFPLTMFLDKEGRVVKITNSPPYFFDSKTKRPEASSGMYKAILRSLL